MCRKVTENNTCIETSVMLKRRTNPCGEEDPVNAANYIMLYEHTPSLRNSRICIFELDNHDFDRNIAGQGLT